MSPKPKRQLADEKVLTVYLGGDAFGIPIAQIQSVLESLPLTHVPLAPAAVKGVMNLRGRIVTAIDLRARLNQLDRGSTGMMQATMSVVIEENGDLYSLLVDRVGDVLTIPAASIDEPPVTMSAAWREVTAGVFRLQDKIMVILMPSALLRAGDE